MKHTCKHCGFSEPEVDFYYRKNKKNGKKYPSPFCKEWERKISKEAKKLRYHDPIKGPIMKSKALKRYTPEYKEKINTYQKNKYAENEGFRENLKDKMRERRTNPEEREKIRVRASSYYQKNKKEISKKLSDKKKQDPKLRLRGFMCSRISEALKSVGKSKDGTPSLQYLKYSWDDLFRHLESQFEDWMSFSNYGAYNTEFKTWQVDHIIPQVFFPYESMDSDLFRMCWDLENLRPLESKQNFTEGNREDILGKSRDIRDIFNEVIDCPLSIDFVGNKKEIFDGLFSTDAAKDACSMRQTGLKYLDSIFTQRFLASTGRMPSLSTAVKDDRRVFRALLNIVKKRKHYSPSLVHANIRFQIMSPGHFFPAAAASIIRAHLFSGGSVYDPFLGWGGRTLGAVCSDVKRLVGCDIQDGIVDNCRQVVSDFSDFSNISSEFHELDALSYLKNSDEKFDLVLTSPPYFDTENYGVESDAMKEGWIDSFIFPFVEELRKHLSSGGRVALHLKDIEGAATFTAYHSAMKAHGFSPISKHKYSRTWSQAIHVYGL